MSHPLIALAEGHEADMLECLRTRKNLSHRAAIRDLIAEAADHATVAAALRAWAAREPES